MSDLSLWSTLAAYQTDFWHGLEGTIFGDASAGGGGAGVIAGTGDLTHVGVAECSTGTTAAGRAGGIIGLSSIRFGGGVWLWEATVRVPTLSTVGEEYIDRIGFLDATATDATDGAYFEYDRLTSGNFWRIKTAAAAARTATVVGAVAAATWYRLGIAVAAAASSVDFYIDGELVGTHTTNTPSGAGRETGVGFLITKSGGLTPRTLEVDKIAFACSLTTPR